VYIYLLIIYLFIYFVFHYSKIPQRQNVLYVCTTPKYVETTHLSGKVYILEQQDRKSVLYRSANILKHYYCYFTHLIALCEPPLWSSGQTSWLQIQRSRVQSRITAELLEWKSSGSSSRKPRLTAVEIRWANHATTYIRKKLALTSPTSGGRLRTKATEF
jgi:hypothetical protein